MIDINKQYRTRDGREVRLQMTDAGGDWPVLGAVKSGKIWSSWVWASDGAASQLGRRDADLIEVKPKHVRWVNFYEGCHHPSREIADRNAGSARIACIRVEFEEGEGLP